jgi:hypothetical protein
LKLAVRHCGARFSEKNLNSGGHFERSFPFMAMKGKLQNQKERNHLTTIRASKKTTTSHLRKEEQ